LATSYSRSVNAASFEPPGSRKLARCDRFAASHSACRGGRQQVPATVRSRQISTAVFRRDRMVGRRRLSTRHGNRWSRPYEAVVPSQ